MRPQKILIIRLSSIGDILLATPLLRALRKKFPAARLDFVVKTEFAEVLRHHPAIDKLYELDSNGGWPALKALGRRLRDERYEVIFDIHKNFRSRYLTRAARPPQVFRHCKLVFKRWLLVNAKINLLRNAPPVFQRYLDAAAPLGLAEAQPLADGRWLELFWREHDEKIADDVLRARSWRPAQPLIGLAPGAGYFTKRWPAEYFGELAADLIRQGHQVVILGGRPDVELAKKIEEIVEAALPHDTRQWPLLNLAGEVSLLGSAAVIKQCRLLVANDSGLMHVAEAVGTPLVAIFGSTTRELGFFPQLQTSRVVENVALSCRPCSHLGHHQCPRRHFRCMKEMTPAQVLSIVQNLLLAATALNQK
ncbi:MAG: lipopolysaccharide heptosyltransferase II [candidate division KSB1 bacterium]|nr:lipopolysaccharide heptosyltransferase II [candidate division KSB1 bacterium]MDZ7366311.1 lipopolysaccharide heptosyltransferase II [candidate division KSB1 bacterium]MDZ7403967.1 lipopolysaccharide heptosyltransferase II [candidate division KSB1 bacterium]